LGGKRRPEGLAEGEKGKRTIVNLVRETRKKLANLSMEVSTWMDHEKKRPK